MHLFLDMQNEDTELLIEKNKKLYHLVSLLINKILKNTKIITYLIYFQALQFCIKDILKHIYL